MSTNADEPNLLLDTCALLYLALGSNIASTASLALGAAAQSGRLWMSPISGWEIGVGVARRRLKLPLPPLEFFRRFSSVLSLKECPVSSEALIASSFLPGDLHRDPMDRILVATAREMDMVLVTSDQKILEYGDEGHVRTLAC